MYRLEVSRTAHRQIIKLPPRTRDRIHEVIVGLAENPRPPGVKKLAVLDGYRVRFGDYRILYTISDEHKLVIVYTLDEIGKYTKPKIMNGKGKLSVTAEPLKDMVIDLDEVFK